MGLNDDVDEGLPNEDSELSDIVTAQDYNPDQPVTEQKTIVADNTEIDSKVTPEDLFGKNLIKNEVPNLNAKFIILQDQADEVSDTIELKETIETGPGVSKDLAVAIESIVPDFLSKDVSIKFFTERPTKTQLRYSLETLSNALDAQYMTLRSNAMDLVKRVNSTTLDVSKAIEENFFKNFNDSVFLLNNNVSKLQNVIETPTVTKSGELFSYFLLVNLNHRDDHEDDKYCEDSQVNAIINDIVVNLNCNRDSKETLLSIMHDDSDLSTLLFYQNNKFIVHKGKLFEMAKGRTPELACFVSENNYNRIVLRPYSSFLSLNDIIVNLAGNKGLQAIRDFKLLISNISTELTGIENGIVALDELTDQPMNLRIEMLMKLASTAKEKLSLLTAISSLFECMFYLVKQTNSIFDILGKDGSVKTN